MEKRPMMKPLIVAVICGVLFQGQSLGYRLGLPALVTGTRYSESDKSLCRPSEPEMRQLVEILDSETISVAISQSGSCSVARKDNVIFISY